MDHDQPTDPTRDDVANLLEQVTPGDWTWFEIDPDDRDWGACEVWAGDNVVSTNTFGPANAALIALAPFLARHYISGALGEEAGLRLAGCECNKPLIGYRPGVGPRCRLCNTEALPSPAALLADALALPEVRAARECLSALALLPDRPDQMASTPLFGLDGIYVTYGDIRRAKMAYAALNGDAE